ncbi:aminotransferase class V-fold PLP-dependent enzyme [Bremerella sp. P1]|uniref:aminotransferase class V-fold PLP-dependent enzyme n=1 Tax=Bremerella sp. P1 TaxID=3026424 RepID=UPI002368B5F9|nr:aminotransferase class V-fold PLP-dependent enzyme [Bremerella sp. P1]WDI41671.1 aminotransferase class V-fold PLP-dependent enzyme [Bremerella sp. P1]
MPACCPYDALPADSAYLDKPYLNTAAEGLPLAACLDAVRQYFIEKCLGEPGRVFFWNQYQRARVGAANLFSVDPSQIALVSSTTEALNTIAHSIEWQPGDEIVLTSNEFPSNIFPWVVLQQKGVRLRIVAPGPEGISIDKLLENINPRTKLITLSQVSYATGELIDPEPIWQRVRDTDTLLCVDATQAAGRVPVRGDLADFTVASAFKWINSIHGTAMMSVSSRVLADNLRGPTGWLSTEFCFADDRFDTFHPRSDAQRFQAGMPNFASVYAVAEALAFHTPERVQAQATQQAPLIQSLRDSLLEMGLDVLLPEDKSRHAGIVSFNCPKAAAWKQELALYGSYVQGDDNRIRAAVHWYNTEQQIHQFLDALARVQGKEPIPTRTPA